MNLRRMGLGFSIALVCLFAPCQGAHGGSGSPSPPEEVASAVQQVIKAGGYDMNVVKAIRTLPRESQPGLAARLVESKNSAMRNEALRLLENFPPEVAAESIRKLLDDTDYGTRSRAALYLAKQAKDDRACTLLFDAAVAPDPRLAVPAVECLAMLGGTNVPEVLVKLLEAEQTDRSVRRVAIAAAGQVCAQECTAVLLKLLSSSDPRAQFPGDNVRACDMAAAALEQIHRISFAQTSGLYFSGPIEKRDEAIARWRQWGAQGGARAKPKTWESGIGEVMDECLTVLQDPKVQPEQRQGSKHRIAFVMRTTFCLGDLSGVDAVVGPTARDVTCIVRVLGEGSLQQFVNCWLELQTLYERNFLAAQGAQTAKPDEQALNFIVFADSHVRFPKLWVWSFCRNFVDRFPGSALRPQVDTTRSRMEAGFLKDKTRVVLHGHIPVLEPIPPPAAPRGATMTPDGPTAVYNSIYASPSDWSLHRSAIDVYRRTNVTMENYPLYPQQSKLYPGSEWPFLANAAYKLRVKKAPAAALDFAEKALILNPTNAKSLAVRGMIQMAAGDREAAAQDLAAAYKLDPKSLGDEPETLQAVVLFAERMAASQSDTAAARTCLLELGELRAYGEKEAVKASQEYEELLRKLNQRPDRDAANTRPRAL